MAAVPKNVLSTALYLLLTTAGLLGKPADNLKVVIVNDSSVLFFVCPTSILSSFLFIGYESINSLVTSIVNLVHYY